VSLVCILNGAAGSGTSHSMAESIVDLFAKQGTPGSVWVADSGAELTTLVNRAIEEKFDIVVAAGGDGTINCISAGLAGTSRILGVLPLGTLNHFAKDLGIPLDLAGAIAVVATGRQRLVDVGEVNGQIFLNNSSLGLYPRLVRERQRLQGEGSGKWAAFARAIGYVLTSYSHLRVRVGTEATNSRRTTPFVFVGNNKYETRGWNVGKRLRLDDGSLWLYAAPHLGPARLILLALRTLLFPSNIEPVDICETKEFWIDTRRARVDVARDGEVSSMTSPLHYRIKARGLRVMAPDNTSDKKQTNQEL
jgi:diacylglycerol kinase family enzyme